VDFQGILFSLNGCRGNKPGLTEVKLVVLRLLTECHNVVFLGRIKKKKILNQILEPQTPGKSGNGRAAEKLKFLKGGQKTLR
jgi:hypothetical protein